MAAREDSLTVNMHDTILQFIDLSYVVHEFRAQELMEV